MLRISVYGKGGIGKSTLSANLSYVLSKRGPVLHVGCDPKADSTRLLAGGKPVRTFLSGGSPETIGGITCVECGGPGAGRGCAGKGLSLLFDSISGIDADYRVCDVLGDVVCGGFSIPMRKGNVDAVILLSSEEYMSVYAMNNILRGLRNINGDPVVLGIVLNSRGGDGSMVRRFSEAVGIPIVLEIPRSPLFARAEAEGRTLCEAFPESPEAKAIEGLCGMLASGPRMHQPVCLSEESMEAIARGTPGKLSLEPPSERSPTFDSFDADRNVTYKGEFAMPACTSHGAADLALMISDAAVILHGPRNCAYLMEASFMRRAALSRAEHAMKPTPCNLYSTCLDAASAFAGGIAPIERTAARVRDDGFRIAFLIPTCSSEVMALDLAPVASRLSRELSMEIIPVRADKAFLSSKFGAATGLFEALISSLPDRTIVPGTVNLFSRSMHGMGTAMNRRGLERLLSLLGLRVNVRLLDYSTMDEIREFRSAEADIGLMDSEFNRRIAGIIESSGRRRPLLVRPPDGLAGTERWLEAVAEYTGRTEMLPQAIEAVRAEYRDAVEAARPRIEGRTAAIFSTFNKDVEWQADALRDAGAELKLIMFGTESFDDHDSRIPEYPGIRVMEGTLCDLEKEISEDPPDVLVTNSPRATRLGVPCSRLGSPWVGIDGTREWLRTLSDSMRIPVGRGWREGL